MLKQVFIRHLLLCGHKAPIADLSQAPGLAHRYERAEEVGAHSAPP